VLSDALWRELFGADPGAVNSVVSINGRPFTIIGIAPRGFTGVARADDPISCKTRGQMVSASPTTTTSTCCATSCGMSVACGPPIAAVLPRARNSCANA
jgi:hypothetical protein